MTRPGILCVGRLYCDLIFTNVPRMPSAGTEVYADGFGMHAGGGAYISAAWFAALGHPSMLASFLPSDPFRDQIVADIRATGVDTGPSRPSPPGLDPQVTVSMVAGDDRAFLTRRAGPPCPDLTAAEIRQTGARHIHIGELATLVEQPGLLAATHEAGATLSLDCSWDETLDLGGVASLLSQVDVFLPNAAESNRLSAAGLPRNVAKLTVIKNGADGAFAVIDGAEHREAATKVDVIDPTGAGDAFNAGFLSEWLLGQPMDACLRAGNALGARAVSRRGGGPASDEFATPRRADPVT